MISDWDYLLKARKGDELASKLIFGKYQKSLIRMTSLITGSLDAAKDVVQDTFYCLINSNIKHQEGNFKTYITTIAYRLALKEKYHKKRYLYVDGEIKDSTALPIEKHIQEEISENIFKIIYSLKPEFRDILVLRFYGNQSYEKISEITKVPLGTVKSRIFYAVKTCGEKLKTQGLFE